MTILNPYSLFLLALLACLPGLTPAWGQAQKSPPVATAVHGDFVTSVAFSPDGKTLASGTLDGNLNFWNLASGKLIRTLTHIVSPLAFSPDGKTLADSPGLEDTSVKIKSIATGQVLRTLTGLANNVSSLAFSPDGKLLAAGSEPDDEVASDSVMDGTTVKLWNVATGRVLKTLREIGLSDKVTSLAFSPDGKLLAAGGGGGIIFVWNTTTWREIPGFAGMDFGHLDRTEPVNSVAFRPGGKTLASGDDGAVMLWELTSGLNPKTLTGPTAHVQSVAFSPDGRTLASSSGDNTVKLWNAATGKLIRTLAGHTEVVFDVAFSPDGRTLASGSGDNTVKLWNAATGKLIRTLSVDTSVPAVELSR